MMIDRCFNSNCRKRLDYLRDGRVVRVIRRKDDDLLIEHFWLCGACYALYDFEFTTEGAVKIREKSVRESISEWNIQDVMLPERRQARRTPGESFGPRTNVV
jgi:hypothetical protein